MAVGSAVSALNRPGWIRKAQQVFTARFALAARRPVRRLPPSPGWTWRCALRKANGRKSLREYPRRSGVYAAPNGSATALPNLVLLSWETGSETGRKGRKGKKKGVARVARKVSKFSKRLLKWLAWFASRLAFWAAQNAAVAAEWAAEEAELAAKVSKRLAGGLTRRKRGRRGVGSGRRRRRQQQKVRWRNKQQQQQQVRQEVQGRLDQVKWEERQQRRWQKGIVFAWWLEQRRAIRVGGNRRSKKSNGSNRRRSTAATGARGTAATARKRRCAARARLAQPSRSMRGVTHAWGMRLGGGGKRGWVT